MNQKEINEIRRHFKPDKSSITRVYGCYVNSNKDIISYVDTSFGLVPQEEAEMYMGFLRKAISGTLGRNLIDLSFTTEQVMDSDEHRLLMALRDSKLQDAGARETLYNKIIQSVSMGDSNYLILLAYDSYDVPYRGSDKEVFADASDQVFSYIVCSVCPVKPASLSLRFFSEENEFHSSSNGQTVMPPEIGFMFPTFDGRASNIYNVLYYARNPSAVHQEVIDSLFHTEQIMSAVQQNESFRGALSNSLEKDCSFDVMQAVHEKISAKIAEYKESRDPEPLEMTAREVSTILRGSGISEEKAADFCSECDRQFGVGAALNPNNIIDARKFQVCTPEVKISVAPEFSYLIETRVINGRKFILVPADDSVEVNGVNINIK